MFHIQGLTVDICGGHAGSDEIQRILENQIKILFDIQVHINQSKKGDIIDRSCGTNPKVEFRIFCVATVIYICRAWHDRAHYLCSSHNGVKSILKGFS